MDERQRRKLYVEIDADIDTITDAVKDIERRLTYYQLPPKDDQRKQLDALASRLAELAQE